MARTPAETVRAKGRLAIAAALVAVAAAYSNAPLGSFVWDDHPLIVEAPEVREPQPLLHYFTRPFWHDRTNGEAAAYWRPLTVLSYAMDWRIHPGNPGGFHLTNLVLHLLCVLLLALLAARWGAPPLVAAFCAGLWGLFPRLTESVTWISGRTDVLATLFVLAGLLAWGESRRRRWIASGFFALGLLSKEVALAFAPAVVALELAAVRAQGRRWGSALSRAAPALMVAAAYALARRWVVGPMPRLSVLGGPGEHLALVLQATGTYLKMLLDPLRPSLLIGLIGRVEPVAIVLGGLCWVGAAGLVGWRARSWRPQVLAGAVLAVAGIGLVLHVIPISVSTIAADRFLYLPLAGTALAIACAGWRLSRASGWAAAGAALVAGAVFSIATYRRNADWANEFQLWTLEARRAPAENPIPRIALGIDLVRIGRPQRALELYYAGLTDMRSRGYYNPTYVGVLEREIQSALADLGRYDDALLVMSPRAHAAGAPPVDHYEYGITLARALRFDEADAQIRAALREQPNYPGAEHALGLIEASRNELKELPPEGTAAGETTAVRVRRARAFGRISRRAEATALWVRVAQAPDATPAEIRDAAVSLLRTGPIEAARVAVARARLAGVPDLSALEELLSARDQEERALGPLAQKERPPGETPDGR